MNCKKYGFFRTHDGSLAGTSTRVIGTEWDRGGRDMIITKIATYVDPQGVTWGIEPGDVTNGTTSPRITWRLIPPFCTKGREAAVFHDVYCVRKSRPWKDVHRMFYFAMRANGCWAWTSWLRWLGTRFLGPRW